MSTSPADAFGGNDKCNFTVSVDVFRKEEIASDFCTERTLVVTRVPHTLIESKLDRIGLAYLSVPDTSTLSTVLSLRYLFGESSIRAYTLASALRQLAGRLLLERLALLQGQVLDEVERSEPVQHL